jgi:hypothetical protein
MHLWVQGKGRHGLCAERSSDEGCWHERGWRVRGGESCTQSQQQSGQQLHTLPLLLSSVPGVPGYGLCPSRRSHVGATNANGALVRKGARRVHLGGHQAARKKGPEDGAVMRVSLGRPPQTLHSRQVARVLLPSGAPWGRLA